jgi:hypothetical protein
MIQRSLMIENHSGEKMQLEQIKVGDVLVTVRSDIACVIEVRQGYANPVRFQMKVGKTYQAKPDFFVSKVGTFDPDSLRVSMDNRFGSFDLPKEPDTGSFFMPPHLYNHLTKTDPYAIRVP